MEGPSGQKMIVWPPIVILENTKYPGMTNDKGIQDGATNARLNSLKKEWHARRAKAIFNRYGHTGATLLEFPKDVCGYMNAEKLDRHLRGLGNSRKDWSEVNRLPHREREKLLRKGDGTLILYGSIALPEDVDNKFLNMKELMKAKVVPRNQFVDDQIYTDREEIRRRQENLDKLKLQNEVLSAKEEEMEAMWHEFEERIEELRKEKKEDLAKRAQVRKRKAEEINAALEEQKRRMRQESLRKQAAEKEAMDGINLRKAGKLMARRAEIRAELDRKREEEQRARQENINGILLQRQREHNAKRLQMLEQFAREDEEMLKQSELRILENRKKVEAERARLLAQAEAELKRLKDEVKEKEEEVEGAQDLNTNLMMADQAATTQLTESHAALLKALEGRQVNGLYVRQFGTLEDPSIKKVWDHAAETMLKGRVRNFTAAKASLMEEAREKLEDAHWMPFLKGHKGHKGPINHEDDFLKKLRETVGSEVEQTVITALLELEEWNPSGRYRVQKVWHKAENRLASAHEIAQCLLDLKPLKSKRKWG